MDITSLIIGLFLNKYSYLGSEKIVKNGIFVIVLVSDVTLLNFFFLVYILKKCHFKIF